MHYKNGPDAPGSPDDGPGRVHVAPEAPATPIDAAEVARRDEAERVRLKLERKQRNTAKLRGVVRVVVDTAIKVAPAVFPPGTPADVIATETARLADIHRKKVANAKRRG